jgi:hypothetical protein
MALTLLACACTSMQQSAGPVGDPRIDQAPMNADSKRQARAYFAKPNPKAFAFAPGPGTNWHAWGYGSTEEARHISIGKCEELTGQRCVLFALNDEIVWQPDAPLVTDAPDYLMPSAPGQWQEKALIAPEPQAPPPRTARPAPGGGIDVFEIEVAHNDELFIINGEKFEAQTYCLDWEEGERVLFVEGSPFGACGWAKLYNVDRRDSCDVWCE